MAPSRNDIIRVCEVLAFEENLRVTVTESAKGALMTAGGALFGSLVMGPIGLAVGGTAASLYAAVRSRGKFRSLVEVIANMGESQKQELVDCVMRVISSVQVQDVTILLATLAADQPLRTLVILELKKFVVNELHMSLL